MGRRQLGLPYRPRNGPDALPIEPRNGGNNIDQLTKRGHSKCYSNNWQFRINDGWGT